MNLSYTDFFLKISGKLKSNSNNNLRSLFVIALFIVLPAHISSDLILKQAPDIHNNSNICYYVLNILVIGLGSTYFHYWFSAIMFIDQLNQKINVEIKTTSIVMFKMPN